MTTTDHAASTENRQRTDKRDRIAATIGEENTLRRPPQVAAGENPSSDDGPCQGRESTPEWGPKNEASVHAYSAVCSLDRWIGRSLTLTIVALIIGLLIAPRPAKAAPNSPAPQRGTVAYCKRHAVDKAKRACIIRVVFAPLGMASKALSVAECESGLDPRARNGEYRGMFQVSAAWRRDVRGFGHLPEQQAWHARRVVTHPEGGWSHWECA